MKAFTGRCGILIGLMAVFIFGANVVVADEAAEQAAAAYREQHGAANVVWMNGLIEDYNNEVLTEQELMRELWAERPAIMNILHAQYGGVFTRCFQIDLIAAETNGVIGTDINANLVFFDAGQFLSATGEVISGKEQDYNNTVRSNRVLNNLYAENQALSCPMLPVTNTCCKNGATSDSCDPLTGYRCSIPANSSWCITGSTACPPPP